MARHASGDGRGPAHSRPRAQLHHRRVAVVSAAAIVAVIACIVVLVSCASGMGGKAEEEPAASPAAGTVAATADGAKTSTAETTATETATTTGAATEAATDAAATTQAETVEIAVERTPEQWQERLDETTKAVEDEGFAVGYYVEDLATGRTLEYDPDTQFYSASSIKGPFCVSVARALGGQARSQYGDTIANCLVNSDNDAYRSLRNTFYGSSFFDAFLDEAGVPMDTSRWYAHYSPRQLVSLWKVADAYLTSGDETAQWVGGLLQDTLNSPLDDYAGADGTVTWSKAGWYSGGGKEYDVTCTGGIVRADGGDYAVAVMIEDGDDFAALDPIVEALVHVWENGK